MVLSFFSSFDELPLWRGGPYSGCTLLTDSVKFEDWLKAQASGSQRARNDPKLNIGRLAVKTERAMAAISKLYPDGVPNIPNTRLELQTNAQLTNNESPAHRNNKVSYKTGEAHGFTGIRKARRKLAELYSKR